MGGVGMRLVAEIQSGCEQATRWIAGASNPSSPAAVAAGCRDEAAGRAWLEFEVQPDGNGARLRQTATFDRSDCGGWRIGMRVAVAPTRVCRDAARPGAGRGEMDGK